MPLLTWLGHSAVAAVAAAAVADAPLLLSASPPFRVPFPAPCLLC